MVIKVTVHVETNKSYQRNELRRNLKRQPGRSVGRLIVLLLVGGALVIGEGVHYSRAMFKMFTESHRKVVINISTNCKQLFGKAVSATPENSANRPLEMDCGYFRCLKLYLICRNPLRGH